MTTALIVEDDPNCVESVVDTLFALGHEHVWASNLNDAREAMSTGDFDYGLFDLEIPARPGRGSSCTENGVRALEDFQQKYVGRVPAIVMTGHHVFCLNHALDLRNKGAVDFIAKPFPAEGRTLRHVIESVLPKKTATSDIGLAFQGGTLEFQADTACLLGVPLFARRGAGRALSLLRELARHDQTGQPVHLSAEDLASRLGSPANVGTVTSCVRLIRSNATTRLKKQLQLRVAPHDVIAHDAQGYFLRDWISIPTRKEFVCDVPADPQGDSPVPAGTMVATNDPQESNADGLNPRQLWILKELQRGVPFERTMLEHRFNIGEKTAKRDLVSLTSSRLVEFVRVGNSGHYRLTNTFRDQAIAKSTADSPAPSP